MTEKITRQSKGYGTRPYLQPSTGRWRAELTLGTDAAGNRSRKVIYGKTRQECANKLKKALAQHDAGTLTAGRAPRFIDWLDHWLVHIAAAKVRPRTLRLYQAMVDNHVRPTTSARIRLDTLGPQHLEKIYAAMRAKGLSASTVAGCHRILARALKVAVQRQQLAVSPATRMDAPQPKNARPRVLTTVEARKLVTAATTRPDGARWLVALVLGLRQGEALGLDWGDVDFAAGTIAVRREVYALPWRHGCDQEGESAGCGFKRAAACPQRRDGGTFAGPPKSEAGTRTVHPPKQVMNVIAQHCEAQAIARAQAGPRWTGFAAENGERLALVFARADGGAISSKRDWDAWRAFLKDEGVAPVRLHDARHTAATTLLALGVAPRVVMDMLGWSQQAMLQRYQHVLDEMKQDVASQLGDALFAAPESPEPDSDPGAEVLSLDAFRARRQA